MDIKERVQGRIKALGKSQRQFAQEYSYSKSSISNYLSGDRSVPLDLLTHLADFCECSVDYLLGRTDSPDPWKSTAMDELGLSEIAVAVLHGETPHRRKTLSDIAGLLRKDIYDAEIANLDQRKRIMRLAVSLLLENENFENALINFRAAIEFTFAVTDSGEKNRPAYKSIDDTKYVLPDGRYSVDIRDAAAFKIAGAEHSFRKAMDDIVEKIEKRPTYNNKEEAANDGE